MAVAAPQDTGGVSAASPGPPESRIPEGLRGPPVSLHLSGLRVQKDAGLRGGSPLPKLVSRVWESMTAEGTDFYFTRTVEPAAIRRFTLVLRVLIARECCA